MQDLNGNDKGNLLNLSKVMKLWENSECISECKVYIYIKCIRPKKIFLI